MWKIAIQIVTTLFENYTKNRISKNFCPKLTYLVTLFDPKLQVHTKTGQNGLFWAFLINFCLLASLAKLNETFSLIFKHCDIFCCHPSRQHPISSIWQFGITFGVSTDVTKTPYKTVRKSRFFCVLVSCQFSRSLSPPFSLESLKKTRLENGLSKNGETILRLWRFLQLDISLHLLTKLCFTILICTTMNPFKIAIKTVWFP